MFADEEAGGDGVDPKPFSELVGHFHRHPSRKVINAGFGGRVPANAGERLLGGHGRNVDDGALVLFDHRLGEDLGRANRPHQVQVHHVLEVTEFQVEHVLVRHQGRAVHVPAGTVHQDVEGSPFIQGLLSCTLKILPLEDVRLQRDGFPALITDLLTEFAGNVLPAAENSDLRSRIRQSFDHGAAEHTGTTRYNRNGPIKLKSFSRTGHRFISIYEFCLAGLK